MTELTGRSPMKSPGRPSTRRGWTSSRGRTPDLGCPSKRIKPTLPPSQQQSVDFSVRPRVVHHSYVGRKEATATSSGRFFGRASRMRAAPFCPSVFPCESVVTKRGRSR